jgi:hypothetical protein
MNVDQQRRMRYFTLGNTIVLLTGVLVIAAGFVAGKTLHPSNVDWQSVLLNIGSDLIVVAAVFFFGKILFIDPQMDIGERLERIEANLRDQSGIFEKLEAIESKFHNQSNFFLTRDQRNSRQTFEQFIENAQDLFLGGVALRTTGRGHRTLYKEKIEKGARLRFLLLDPESSDVAAIAATFPVPTEHIANDIRSTISELKYLQGIMVSSGSGSVEVRLLKREPVFSFALRNVSEPNACLRADMRVYGLDTALRPGWELTHLDGVWFRRFVQMCEALWADSKPLPDEN